MLACQLVYMYMCVKRQGKARAVSEAMGPRSIELESSVQGRVTVDVGCGVVISI